MFSELPSFLRLTIYGWCGNVILGESTTLDRSLEINFPAMKACEQLTVVELAAPDRVVQ